MSDNPSEPKHASSGQPVDDEFVSQDDPAESEATGEHESKHAEPDDQYAGEDGPVRRKGDGVRTVLRGVGQTLITLGVVVLLFIVYEAFITNIFNAQKQNQLHAQLEKQWDDPTVGVPQQETKISDVPIGDAFAILRIPAFGADFNEAIVEGTTEAALVKGPGHYPDTVGPGEVGNFAIAGHRVGKGSPFLNLDKLKPGEAIVFETKANWYIYRVIGKAGTDDYADPAYPAKGMTIVKPSDYDVIAPVPGDPSAQPIQKLLTLTTCHPKFSAAERLIVHAYLEGEPLSKAQYPSANDVPALKEG